MHAASRAALLTLAFAAAFALAPPAAAEDGKPADAKPVDPRAERIAAYDRGLAWLRSQAKDGTFGAQGKADPGLTALALSAFLHRPGGVDAKDEDLVEKGIAYLVSMQRPDGGIYDQQNANYTTALAVQALAAAGKPAHRPVLDRAVEFLRKMQYWEGGPEGRKVDPKDPRYGGVGYGSDPTQPDLSNTQFAIDSLRAAGVPADDPALKRAVAFLQRAQNRKENETEGEPKEWKDEKGNTVVRSSDGGAGYRPGDSKAGTFRRPDGKMELRSYGSMTYALVKCYIFAGLPKDDPRVADAVRWIRDHYTWTENPGFPAEAKGAGAQGLYYYYATAARCLALLGDGAAGSGPDGKPRDWKSDLARVLLAARQADGSWVNRESERWNEGVPLVATAFALQALGETAK